MNRRIALIAVAVILALVGTFAVYNYAHNADKRAVDSTRAAQVLIAQKQVPAGTKWSDAVKGGYFSQENIPANSAPASALASTSASVPADEVATADIASGQIVLRPMFSTKTPTTGVLAIPKGMQALSISLSSTADVAGYVESGSQIAIYATFKINDHSTGAPATQSSVGTDLYATKLLLPRVDVIATSQGAPADVTGAKGGANASSVTLTLSVNQQQAQQVILAQQVGSLYLALLSDTSITNTGGGTVNLGVFKPTPIFLN